MRLKGFEYTLILTQKKILNPPVCFLVNPQNAVRGLIFD